MDFDRKRFDQEVEKGRKAGVPDDVIFQKLSETNTFGPHLRGKKPSEFMASAATGGTAKEDKTAYGHLSDFSNAAVERAKDLYYGGKQLASNVVPAIDRGELQQTIDERKKQNKELYDTPAGMVGAMVPDVLGFALPGGALVKGASYLPKAVTAAKGIPGMLSRFGGAAVEGGLQSAVEPVASDETQMEKTTQGVVGGLAGRAAQSAAGRVITPFRTTNAKRQAHVKLLEGEDIPVSAGQATGNRTLQDLEMTLQANPMTSWAVTAGGTPQKEAVTQAFSKHIGEFQPRITDDELLRAHGRVSAPYNKIEKANSGVLDNTFQDDLLKIVDKVTQTEGLTGAKPGLSGLEALMGRYATGEPLTGAEYNLARSSFTKEASKAARSGDTAEAEVMRDLRDTLDRQADRFWGPQGAWDPGKNVDLADARRMHGVVKDLETPGVLKDNLVDTEKLRSVVQRKNPEAFATGGGGDYADLVRAAEVLKPGPDSGTARRLFINTLLGVGGVGGAGAAGYNALNDPVGTTATVGGIGGILALTQTKAGRKYLTNKLLNEGRVKELADLNRFTGSSIGAGLNMRED